MSDKQHDERDQPARFKPGDRQTCTPAHPRPRGDQGRWQHTNVESTGECSEGCCDYYRCKDCGHSWKEEVAQ